MMAKNKKGREKQLKGVLLTRFFFVLIIVSIVELILVAVTNQFIIPSLITINKYDTIIKIDGAEGLFVLLFVMVTTAVVKWIFPALKISPVAVNDFLEKLLISRGLSGGTAADATETVRQLSENKFAILSLIGSFLLVAIILMTPYIVGGIVFSVSVARELRALEREKEEERQQEEKRRYLMISNIVHDLKTPMTTVYGYAKAMNDGIVPADKQPEYLDAIMKKTERTNAVIAMLLDYVKLDSEGFTIKRERIDVCELLRSCAAFCYTDIEAAGDELDIDVPEKPLYISADNIQMSRVITNLITNAIKHNPEGTKIGIFIKCENYVTGEDIRVLIADTGDEIPEELRDSIFEPFVTSDESRSSSGGTGLGLPLSERICKMHDFSLRLIQNPEIKRYHLADEYKKVFMISM